LSQRKVQPSDLQLHVDDVPFRGIVEQSLAGIYVVLDERFMYANDTFASMFGYSRDEFIGRRMRDCVTEDSVDEVMHNYRRRISGEVSSIHYFTKGRRKDGRVVHLELHASRVDCRGTPALAGVALDVTERVQRQEELRRSRERLRALTRHINSAREVERARLAGEVHDVLGGMLSAAKFDLTRMARRTEASGQQELQQITADLMDLMQETIDTARAISNELRPTSLDLLGLPAALRQAVERFAERHQITVTVHCDPALPTLPGAVSVQVFRIVQEALTNVARHAQATHIELDMGHADGNLWLRLSDNGCGLPSSPVRPGAFGLFSMTERAHGIGGELVVRNADTGGTELRLTLPLPATQDSATP
jgi:two-component system sensor histidine kinase UhpB